MNAKEQLKQMVGSDFMSELSEMTAKLEAADGANSLSAELETLAVDVMYNPARNRLGADVWIYFGKSPEFSVVQVELLQDGMSIAKNTLAVTEDATKNIIVSGAAKKEVKAADLKVHITAVGKRQRSMAEIYDETFSAGYVYGMSDIVKTIEVENPRNIKTQYGQPIHVSFDRQQQLQTVDYDYTKYRVTSGLQDAYLAMSGTIYLNDGYEYITGSYQTDKIFLQNGDDRHLYENSEATLNKSTAKSIHYEYNEKWNCTIPKSVKTVCSAADLRSQATFKYKKTSSGEESTCVVVISSKDYSLGDVPNNYKKIPGILFYWGCLEENTEITMADGSHKKIRDIQIGERVCGTNHEACQVRNVIRGVEDMLICITLTSGKEIFLTPDHPFQTKTGSKAAIDLEFGDEILTESGYESIEGARPVNEKFHVCSIDISPSDFIWGNGIAVGDYEEQGKSIKALESRKKSAVSEQIIEECRKINQKYHQKY